MTNSNTTIKLGMDENLDVFAADGSTITTPYNMFARVSCTSDNIATSLGLFVDDPKCDKATGPDIAFVKLSPKVGVTGDCFESPTTSGWYLSITCSDDGTRWSGHTYANASCTGERLKPGSGTPFF